MAVDRPELLTATKPADQFEGLVKAVGLFTGTSSAIPEAVLGLEPVLALWHLHGGEALIVQLHHHLVVVVAAPALLTIAIVAAQPGKKD